ncbi:hypothetical protein HPB49_025919 [Dermacentor silvarum]|nr:hypothetical protein HPB49_025919 [Dermacentor silvarum]
MPPTFPPAVALNLTTCEDVTVRIIRELTSSRLRPRQPLFGFVGHLRHVIPPAACCFRWWPLFITTAATSSHSSFFRAALIRGLDRVSRHPALVAELAEVLSISQVETAGMVQRRFRSIEGLHEFMRLAGVVKERVTCLPREDGHMQLDDLNDDCWAHVRRFLELDDVSASPSCP